MRLLFHGSGTIARFIFIVYFDTRAPTVHLITDMNNIDQFTSDINLLRAIFSAWPFWLGAGACVLRALWIIRHN